MTTQKATKATITLGSIKLDCYQMPDGAYMISQSQTTEAVLKPAKRMVELAQSERGQILIQSGFEKGLKVSVEGSKPVNLVPLEVAFQFWVLELAIGNQDALALVIACGAEALERRADAAFGVKRSEQERDDRLAARSKGVVARRTLTDAIRDYLEKFPQSENYNRFIWSNCSDHLNKIILGCKAKQAKEFYQVPASSLLRNHIPVAALRELEMSEELASRLIDERDMEPLEAVKQACVQMFTKTIGLE